MPPHTNLSLRRPTRYFCPHDRCQWQRSLHRCQVWTRHSQPSQPKTNLRRLRQPQPEVVVKEAGVKIVVVVDADPPEAADRTGEARTRVKARGGPREGQDTHLTHQRPAVNAITFTETRHGTAWLHSPVHGCPSAFQDHEDQTSLTRNRNRLITTTCFRVCSRNTQ